MYPWLSQRVLVMYASDIYIHTCKCICIHSHYTNIYEHAQPNPRHQCFCIVSSFVSNCWKFVTSNNVSLSLSIYTYICICVNILSIYIYVYIYMYICISIYIHMYKYIYIHKYIYTYIHVCIYIYVHTYVYTYTYTYSYIYIYVYLCMRSRLVHEISCTSTPQRVLSNQTHVQKCILL